MIQPLRDWGSPATRRAALAATLATTVAGVLLFFPPDRYNFYPRCPIATYLHLQCPGCGTTRALAALLRGQIAEAFRLNPLSTILLPGALLFISRHLWVQCDKDRLTLPHPPGQVLYALLSIAAIFTVARNLML